MVALSHRSFLSVVAAAAALCASTASAAVTSLSAAKDAVADVYNALGGGNRAFFAQGVLTDLQWEAPGTYIEYSDGTARLNGIVRSQSTPGVRFIVDFDFASRVKPGDASYPPAGSPKLDLAPPAYVGNGGPVDPATWHYYLISGGTFTGLDLVAGSVLQWQRFGPAWQVGVGANGVNANPGASGWFTITTLTQPSNQAVCFPTNFFGDGNIDLDTGTTMCVEEAQDDAYGQYAAGHALYLPGVATDLVHLTPGTWVVNANGTAKYTGVVARLSDPNKGFTLNVDYSGLLCPGDASYPPAMSPKKELSASAYVENGGIVDTNTWCYYTAMTGTLTGIGDWAGATLTLAPMGPAFQIGVGANGKNINFGGSGWLTVTVNSKPSNGSGNSWANSLSGDFNLDMRNDCAANPPAGLTMTATPYGAGCNIAGGNGVTLALNGPLTPGTVATFDLSGGHPQGIGLMLFGTQQAQTAVFGNCNLLVSPILPFVFGPFPLDANGAVALAGALPLTFSPVTVTIQAATTDNQGGIALSNGLQVVIQ